MSPLLSAATAVYRGSTPVTGVYAGAVKVWPAALNWVDDFNRTAANLAALGNGWNAAGTGATASANGADLAYLANGFYGRILTPTTSALPADYGVEVVAPRTTWDDNYIGIVARWNGTSGVKLWNYSGVTVTQWQIGGADDHGSNNATLTLVNGFPAGWANAGDHTMRLEMRGARADVFADGQHVGYRAAAPTSNSGVTGTQGGFCGDSGGAGRVWRSIRFYAVTGTTP